jgi:hypothetical protein
MPAKSTHHFGEAGMAPKNDLTEFEQIETEWKRLQVLELRERLQTREDERARLKNLRDKQVRDFEKAQATIQARQRVCKHRKGGRDNRFSNGNDNNYCVIRNTYPNGDVVIMCSRCFMEVRRPDPRERKKDPEGYKERLALWKEWDAFPTDNTPSGGKIFEVIPAA